MKMRRKNIIKRAFALATAFALLAALAACGNGAGNSENTSEPNNQTTQDKQTAAHEKYKEAMQNMLDNLVFPNGEQVYTNAESEDEQGSIWTDNKFAIADIDGDGTDELIINFSNAPAAGEVFYIFEYDEASDSLKEEFTEFPTPEFYDNGYVTAGASHNQGMAGDFWPYTIYKYDAESDTYVQQYYIDAWDKELYPQDFEGNAYPNEIDTSNTGTVYYLYEDVTKAVDPVDKTAYDKLARDTYGSAAEVTIVYSDISQENIEAIS